MSGITFQMLLAGGRQARLTLIDHDVSSTVGTSHTFSMDCGAGGNIIVAAQAAMTGEITGITVNGNAATQRAYAALTSSSHVAIYTISGVASGTHNVVISVSGAGSQDWGCQTYTIAGHASLVPDSTATDITGTDPTATLNVPAGATVLGAVMAFSGTPSSFSWSGLSEDVDESVRATISVVSTAHAEFPAADASLDVTATVSASGSPGSAGAWCVWAAA